MPAGSSGCIRYSSQVCSTCLLHVRTTLLVIGYVFIPAILLLDCQVGSRSPCDAHSPVEMPAWQKFRFRPVAIPASYLVPCYLAASL